MSAFRSTLQARPLATTVFIFLVLPSCGRLAGSDARPCLPEFESPLGFPRFSEDPFVIRDLNSDGRDDFVLFSLKTRAYLAGEGRTFRTVEVPSPGSCTMGGVGDFNGDGSPDLVMDISEGPVPNCGSEPGVEALRVFFGGSSDGAWTESFGPPVTAKLPGRVRKMAVQDLDGDGADDLFVVLNCLPAAQDWGVQLAVLFGKESGGGPFSPPLVLPATSSGEPWYDLDVAFGDLDGDGSRDLVVWDWQDTHDIYFGNQSGGQYLFESPLHLGWLDPTEHGLALLDVNGDGADDVLWGSFSLPPQAALREPFALEYGAACYLGTSDRTFPPYKGPLPLVSTQWTIVEDFDGDGTKDLAHDNGQGIVFFLCKDEPSLTFARASPEYWAGLWPWWIDRGDFDGDGRTDIAVKTSSWPDSPEDEDPGFWILFNDGSAIGRAPRLRAPEMLTARASPMAIMARDLNADGRLDLAFGTPETYVWEPEAQDYTLVPPRYGVFLASDPGEDGSSYSGPEFFEFGAPPYGLENSDFCREIGAQGGDPEEEGEDVVMCDREFYATLERTADINADGLDDRVMVLNNSTCPTCPLVTEVYAAFGRHLKVDPGHTVPTGPMAVDVDWKMQVADGTKGFAAADLDGDGDIDLAVGGFHGGTITLLMNQAPCAGKVVFLRGDPNADGFMNIGDCVFILMYLFLGAEASCPAAMDVDGNDLLDLSDPIGLLGFLFLGTAPPAPPYPFLGAHSVGDPLPCAR